MILSNNIFNGVVTASGTSAPMQISGYKLIGLFANVSAVSGTVPVLVITLQHTPNGTDWYPVPAPGGGNIGMGNLTTTGLNSSYGTVGQGISTTVRCLWTVTGTTPSFTVSVDLLSSYE